MTQSEPNRDIRKYTKNMITKLLIRRETVQFLSSEGKLSKKGESFQYERINRICFYSVPIVVIAFMKIEVKTAQQGSHKHFG